jgi:hypothetical protein
MTETFSIADYKKTAKKPAKFRNVWTVVDGIKFQSKREAARWSELRILEAAGAIAALKRQVRFVLTVHHVKVGIFVADFTYIENGQRQVEDSKGRRDSRDPSYQLFKLKAALMKAIYGIEVREV